MFAKHASCALAVNNMRGSNPSQSGFEYAYSNASTTRKAQLVRSIVNGACLLSAKSALMFAKLPVPLSTRDQLDLSCFRNFTVVSAVRPLSRNRGKCDATSVDRQEIPCDLAYFPVPVGRLKAAKKYRARNSR